MVRSLEATWCPLALFLSSFTAKEWENSERDPLKLNLNVWLSLLRNLEKLFLRGGGAPPPCSASGLILKSPAAFTTSWRHTRSLITFISKVCEQDFKLEYYDYFLY